MAASYKIGHNTDNRSGWGVHPTIRGGGAPGCATAVSAVPGGQIFELHGRHGRGTRI